MKAAAEDIYDSLFNADTFIAVDNGIAHILEGVADITDGMGGLKGVISAISALVFQLYGTRIADGIRNMITSLSFETG